MHEQFERDILEAPDDLNRYAVYADWLSDQGDPRGEFMHVQLRLEEDGVPRAERVRLKQREAALLAQHRKEWLGELAQDLILEDLSRRDRDSLVRIEFSRGWLSAVSLKATGTSLVVKLLAVPEARFLRQLSLSWQDQIASQDWDVLLGGSKLLNLRRFQLGFSDHHPHGLAATDFVTRFPRLEVLHLEARRVDTSLLFSLPMPHLRELVVHHLDDYPVDILAANPTLSQLETLSFHPQVQQGDEEEYLLLQDLEAVAGSPFLKKLRHLELHSCGMGDAGCVTLVESDLLRHLRILDLTYGSITDAGAQTLASAPEIHNLEHLVLNGNALSERGIRWLKAANPHVEAENQWDISAEDDFDEEDENTEIYEGDEWGLLDLGEVTGGDME